MLITVICPRCKSQYHVSDVLLGQIMRCPNSNCRLEFAVGVQPRGEEEPGSGGHRSRVPSTAPGPGTQWSGSVNDFVTMLPAEEDQPVDQHSSLGSKHVADILPIEEAEVAGPLASEPTEVSWDQPPPVRKPPAPEPARKKPAPRQNPPSPPPVVAPTRVATPIKPVVETVEPAEPVEALAAVDPPQPPSADAPAEALVAEPVLEVAEPAEPVVNSWEDAAPPVRRDSDGTRVAEEDSSASQSLEAAATARKRRKRRNLWIVLVTAASVVFVGAGFVLAIRSMLAQSEGSRATTAYDEFKRKRFLIASEDFDQIVKQFVASDRLDEYRSMADLSRTLASASVTGDDPLSPLEAIGKFAQAHKSDAIVKEHAGDVGQITVNLAESLIAGEKENPNEGSSDRLRKVNTVLEQVAELGAGALDDGAREKLRNSIAEAENVHTVWARRRDLRLKVLSLLGNRGLAPVEAFKVARDLLRRSEREFPGFGDDSAIKTALVDLDKRHLASVVCTVAADRSLAPVKAGARSEIPYPSIIFDPRADEVPSGPAAAAAPDERVVLALVRGVLYAQSATNGRVLWAARVGVDSTTLPVRVPRTAAVRERILVLLADTATVMALDPSGAEVWRYRMGSPCLGRPVVIDSIVLLPTYDGHVHEVELSEGRLVALWNLGQPLSYGGAREGNSKVVYFPADDSFIYALNVDPAERSCKGIINSNHAAGSLRGEPIVISPSTRNINDELTTLPGYLVLNLTDGLDSTQLRVFPLPLTDRVSGAPSNEPSPRLRGWTSFNPFHDPEKVAVVTDAGSMGVYGVRQAGNRDPDLFPLMTLNLDALLKPEGAHRGRAQIVTMKGDDSWVLANGKLQRFEKVATVAAGPRLHPSWTAALELGSPLHESQEIEDPATGQKTLVVVTQALKQPVCLSTAVRSDDGETQWQRRLGLLCQGAPVPLGARPAPADAQEAAKTAPAEAIPPVLLTPGRSGEVFSLDPIPFGQQDEVLSAARSLVAGPMDENSATPPVLLAGADGTSAYEVAFPGSGNVMVVRKFRYHPEVRRAKMEEQKAVKLPDTVSTAGVPIITGNWLVVPLTNGVLFDCSLSPLAEKFQAGTNWRSTQLGSDKRCYLAALAQGTFVAGDGGARLTFWKIADSGLMSGLFTSDKSDDEKPVILGDTIAAAPVVLSTSGAATYLLVADSNGVLRTIRVLESGAQEDAGLRWDLGGSVTAGPFLRTIPGSGPRIGCVVDGCKLVWIDPLKTKEILWRYGPTRASIPGEPQIADGKIIVADQAGGIVALDPATGAPQGKGYILPGSVAATAPPVAFDGNRLFTPLTDGTVLLVPLDRFR